MYTIVYSPVHVVYIQPYKGTTLAKLTTSTIATGYAAVAALNSNFDAIETAMENTLSRDGTTPNQMNADIDLNGYRILNQANPVAISGFTWSGSWTTARAYTVGTVVENGGTSYICIVAHTSGTFATDLAAAKWQLVATSGLPSQTGNNGKLLTTNGSTASWTGGPLTVAYGGTGAGTTTDARASLGLRTVQPGETIVLAVPSVYATIQAAIDEAQKWHIKEGGYLRITVADGTHTLTAGVSLNHPDGYGNKFQIVGNTTTPANCVIAVTYSGALTFDCFTVSNGNWVYVDGFKFLKSAKAASIDNTTALLATYGSALVCGSSIIVDNWYYGIAARDNSMIYCPSVSVDHSGDVGIWAYRNSYVYAASATSNRAVDSTNNLGYGFQAEYGSTLVCNNGSATGCLIAGVGALSNSIVEAAAVTSSTNTGSGIFSNESSTVYASGATVNSNSAWGVDSRDTSTVSAIPIGANNTGNTLGSFSFIPRTVTADGAVLVTDKHIIANKAGTLTLTMLNAASYPGKEITIRTITANTVVSSSSAGGLGVVPRAGGAAGTAILAATAGAWVRLVSDGTNWQVMEGS